VNAILSNFQSDIALLPNVVEVFKILPGLLSLEKLFHFFWSIC
jgi:hypothetical protein